MTARIGCRRSGLAGDQGSAVAEFALGVSVLMVPVVYAALALVAVQQTANMVTTAAHEAGRAFSSAPDVRSGRVRAARAVELAAADQGVPAGILVVQCLGGACLSAGTSVRTTVTSILRVPLLGEVPVRMRSSHTTPARPR